MRRGVVILVAAVAAIGILAGGLGWLLTDARPPAGASRAERLYYAYCAECHGTDGAAPRDPCFGGSVGSGGESVRADRRTAVSMCVVERGRPGGARRGPVRPVFRAQRRTRLRIGAR